MRRSVPNLVVFATVLTITLSTLAVLPATSLDKGKIISKLEELRGMVEGEHPSLENKVNAVIHQVEAGTFNGALNKLENDVKKSIIALVDNPEDLIRLVDEIIDLIREITPLPTPDFDISAFPEKLEIVQNSSDIAIINVTSLQGFNQGINISAELTLATDKVTLTLNPTWVIPTPGGNTSTLTVAVALDAEAREHIITVTGTNGTLQHSVNVMLVVTAVPTPPFKDFSMGASPTSLVIQKGDSNISLITITSLKGFSQLVDLTIVSQPVSDVNVTLNPLQVIPPPNESAFSVLTIDVGSGANLGTYNITVEGTSGLLQHSVNIVLEVTAPPVLPTSDFSIAAFPTYLVVQQGDSDKTTIIIASLRGFNWPVDLTVTSESISGVKLTFDPSEVTPPANGFATSTLTIEVATNASPNLHTITVAGKSGVLEYFANISFEVVVEKTPPIIVSVFRQPAKPSYTETVTVSASVTDVGSGVKDVIISYSSGATWKNETTTLKEGLYRAIIPAFPFNTMVNYRVYASDNVGNWAVPSSIYSYVVADLYPPVIGYPSWSPQKPAANEEITINVTVTEPPSSSGVKNVTLWYGNATIETWLPVPMTLKSGVWTATIANQSDTVVTFLVEACDNAGNMAYSEEHKFAVGAPPGIPLAWILLIIVILAALTGSAAYLLLRRRQRRKGAGVAPPVKVTPPSPPPPPVAAAEKPSEKVADVKGYGMVSFVVPAHNEEDRISGRIARAYERAVGHVGPSEIIVVDDGSIDNTYEAAWLSVEAQRKRWPNIPVKVVKLSANLGREEAVRVGRSKATGEFVETVNGNNHAVSSLMGSLFLSL